jgi:hypothetical protein
MPVSQASFSNNAPDDGEIRILVQTINSVDFIKAVTVSNQDLDGNNIRISLNEVESIRAALTGSAITGTDSKSILQVESISEKSNYFFLDTTDQSIISASSDPSQVIGISPFLTQPFFYNNYNALISNASEPRPSVSKFDVDRVSGFVHPSNYTAIAGIGELDFADLKFNSNGVERSATSVNQSTWNTSNFELSGSTTTAQTFRGDRNVTIRVDNTNIEEAVGIIQSPVISMKPEFFEDPSAYATINSSLNVEIDNTPDFNSGNLITASLATQTFVNGNIEHNTTPFATSLTPNTFSGDDIYVRLHQKNTVVSSNKGNNTSEQSEITIKSFFYTKPQLSKLLEVRQYFDQQDPYAPLAQVQDSNYTTTGHTNARYNGTKTTEDDYSGIEPFLAATPIQGTTYRIDEDDNFICSQSLDDRDLEDFLFLGSGNIPTLGTSDLGVITSTAFIDSTGSTGNVLGTANDQSFNMTVNIGLNNRVIKIKPGNVLLLTDPNNGNTEVVLVTNNLQVTETTAPYAVSLTTREIQVSRRYDGESTNHTFPDGTIVEAFTDTRIFKLEGSRLIAVDEKKIWIKDNRTVLKTNNSGYVISLSTTCTV